MKTTLFLALLFIVILGGGYLWKGRPVANVVSAPTAAVQAVATSTSTVTAPGTYTKAQVALHDTSNSCWTSINGNVYDLTAWIPNHPGGEAHIESLCGNDGTSAFEAQHADSAEANAVLATFKIGTLVQ
jgi:cytochrome b involved in lipid metabolism